MLDLRQSRRYANCKELHFEPNYIVIFLSPDSYNAADGYINGADVSSLALAEPINVDVGGSLQQYCAN